MAKSFSTKWEDNGKHILVFRHDPDMKHKKILMLRFANVNAVGRQAEIEALVDYLVDNGRITSYPTA